MGRHLLKLGEYIYSGYSWTKLILGCSLKSAGIHACLVTPSIRSVKPAHNSCSNKLSATLQCHYHLRKFPDKIKRGVDTPYQISGSHLCLYPHFRNNFLTQVEATLQITVTPKRYMNENNFFPPSPFLHCGSRGKNQTMASIQEAARKRWQSLSVFQLMWLLSWKAQKIFPFSLKKWKPSSCCSLYLSMNSGQSQKHSIPPALEQSSNYCLK